MAAFPSVEDVICIMQNCRRMKDLAYAKRVHAYICSSGLQAHRSIGNHIVPMFVDCGSVSDAQKSFDGLVHRNEHSWTSLIGGYIQCGQMQHAVILYHKMQENSVLPSRYTLVALLKAFARLKDVERGRVIHVEIMQKGFEKDLFVGGTLVDMYAKCGLLAEAQEVFDNLPIRHVVPWTTLIAGYAEHRPVQEALTCFEQMQLEGFSPDAVTYVCVLKACGNAGALEKGREIHMEISGRVSERCLLVGNTLVDMYAKCGSLTEAQEVFDKLPIRDFVSWTSLIAGYAEHGPCQEALRCFEQMQFEGISSDAVTFVCILKACGSLGAMGKGREIHPEIIRKGVECDLVGNALVNMYAKCGSLLEAREVFNKLRVRDVVSWAALITGYAEHGPEQEALKCFELMRLEGVFLDAVTFICILKACASLVAMDEGQQIHAEITQKGFETDLLIGSSLVDMYCKCGSFVDASKVVHKLPIRDVVVWASLLAGYAEHGPQQEALKIFEQMQAEGVSPSDAVFVCVLKACGSIGALGKGREIHSEITYKGFERDLSVGSALIDMYAKCGSLSEAHGVFHKLPVQHVVSWSAMIKGYGLNEEGSMAVECFEDMQELGVTPDAITFTCLLTACSHTNLVFKGLEYFKVMREEYGIAPTLDHYTCMIDLFARSGQLYEAEKFLETVQCPPSEEMWTALFSACKNYVGEADLGLRCFQQLVLMNRESAASYVLMASIYASAGRWDEAQRIEELRKHTGVKKKPATALIEVNYSMHEFVVGDEQSEELLAILEILSSRSMGEGHVPNLDLVLNPQSYENETSVYGNAKK